MITANCGSTRVAEEGLIRSVTMYFWYIPRKYLLSEWVHLQLEF